MSKDSLKPKSKSGRGGARPGAGRPKGKAEPHTIEARKAKERFISRVAKNADKLFNAQLNKAIGETYLMWEHQEGRGKNAKTVVEIVTDPKIIQEYLDGSIESPGYYYITTKPADNSAITDMLNRGLGKPTEHIEADVTSDGERITGVSDQQFAQLMRARAERSNL